MKYLLTVAVFILTFINVFSQAPTKEKYIEDALKPMYEKYNITDVPSAFEDCAYQAFLKHTDKNDDGFSAGRETVQVCFPTYINGISFSDSGNKIKDIFLPYTLAICQDRNSGYSAQLNVKNYCECLVNMYRDEAFTVSRLLNPDFVNSKEYKNMALQCVDKNKD